MEHTSSIATNNNWCYQSFFIDTDYIYFYLHTKIEIKKVGENQYSISTYYYDNGAWQYSESETITLNGKSFKYDGDNCTILTLTSKTLIYEAVEPNGEYYDKYTYIKM